MGFLGIVGAGLAGGVAGVGEGMAQSGLEQQKADAIALRDKALASLQQQTHGIELQQGTDSALAAVGPMADAQNKAANANAADANKRLADQTTAKDDAAAQSAGRAPITPEQQVRSKQADAALAETQAYHREMTASRADTNAARVDATTARANTAGDRAQPTDQWMPSKDDPSVASSKALPGWTKKENDGTPATLAKQGSLIGNVTGGLFGTKQDKAADPGTGPTVQYYDPSGKPRSAADYAAELAKTGRGGLRGGGMSQSITSTTGFAPTQGSSSGGGFPTPTDQAVQALRTNPALKTFFDQKFGPGASDQYLGQ